MLGMVNDLKMANSVDPDQTASDLGMHCFHMPFLSETLVFDIYHMTCIVGKRTGLILRILPFICPFSFHSLQNVDGLVLPRGICHFV